MRTLALLAALLLLGTQALSEGPPEPAEDAQNQIEPEEAEEEMEDTLSEAGSSALQRAGLAHPHQCQCRKGPCRREEQSRGSCGYLNRCCRRRPPPSRKRCYCRKSCSPPAKPRGFCGGRSRKLRRCCH